MFEEDNSIKAESSFGRATHKPLISLETGEPISSFEFLQAVYNNAVEGLLQGRLYDELRGDITLLHIFNDLTEIENWENQSSGREMGLLSHTVPLTLHKGAIFQVGDRIYFGISLGEGREDSTDIVRLQFGAAYIDKYDPSYARKARFDERVRRLRNAQPIPPELSSRPATIPSSLEDLVELVVSSRYSNNAYGEIKSRTQGFNVFTSLKLPTMNYETSPTLFQEISKRGAEENDIKAGLSLIYSLLLHSYSEVGIQRLLTEIREG